jgi:predicted nucleic acid-binding protein
MTISGKKILVDTNILAYLTDNKSPFFPKAFAFFEWAEENGVKLTLTQQNIIEFIRTLVRDYGSTLSKAVERARALLSEREFVLINPLPTTLDLYCELVGRGNKGTFDLYMAATAIDNGVDCIVTNDPKGFKNIEGLEVLSLAEFNKFIGGKIRVEHD